jgi:L-cysteine:1D-myo-inositol 2-amino-2-deoxy-alpha-D-glucopyranoside ligase
MGKYASFMESWSRPYLPPAKSKFVTLKLRDSYSGELVDVNGGGIYVCGITPYDATHLGHAATYLSFDLISRYLLASGSEIRRTQNVTDIDDPLLERANRDGVPWKELAEGQIQLYRDDMTALRVIPPDNFLSVIENMKLIISYIEKLVSSGKTYAIEGDIYLDLSLIEGALENLPIPLSEAIQIFKERGGDPERVGKRHPLDTLVWMKQRVDEPGWESSFGKGRPGWHIECVALALSSLDNNSKFSLEIQGGGSDLKFPHHYMTAVQAQAITGRPFSSVYVHTGMIGLNGEKMSKSRGNLIFVSKLLNDGIDPNVIRIALIQRHYSEDTIWSDATLQSAQIFLDRLRNNLAREEVAATDPIIANVVLALANNLDTPRVFALLDSWCEKTESGETAGNAGELSRALDLLLGLAI